MVPLASELNHLVYRLFNTAEKCQMLKIIRTFLWKGKAKAHWIVASVFYDQIKICWMHKQRESCSERVLSRRTIRVSESVPLSLSLSLIVSCSQMMFRYDMPSERTKTAL